MHATVNVLNATKLYNSEVFHFSDSEYHHASSHDLEQCKETSILPTQRGAK